MTIVFLKMSVLCFVSVLFIDDHPGSCGFSRVPGCSGVPPQPCHETVGLNHPFFSKTKTTIHHSKLIRYDWKCVYPRVPAPVLMSKFSDTTKALMEVMSKQAMSETASALRWVSSIISFFLIFFPFFVSELFIDKNCTKD